VEDQGNLALGANCQVFAYELLRFFGKTVPDYRSSDLWEDEDSTRKVADFEPLDFMVYNSKPEPYGAHIGVYIGDGNVIHLSKNNGIPKVEKHEALLAQEKYAIFIGAKRVI